MQLDWSLRCATNRWLGMLVLGLPLLFGCGTSATAPSTVPVAAASRPESSKLWTDLDEELLFTFKRKLTLRDHAAWQIIHGAVPFKRSFLVEANDQRMIPVVDFLLQGGKMKGWEFEPGDRFGDRRGLRSIVEQGSKTGQGHPDQWFGYLSGCELTPEQTIVVGNETYTVADLIQQVEWDVPRITDREFSWTLMGLSAYRPSNYEWVASDGKTWSLEKLVAAESEQELGTSACGGSHRMSALALALNRHLAQGGKLEGGWALADAKIKKAIQAAHDYQNPDGSFSVNFFERPGTSADIARGLGATGHILEFLVLAMDDRQVREPWVERAVVYLCKAFRKTRDVPIECGALYHSASGLLLYRERLFGPLEFPTADSPPAETTAADSTADASFNSSAR
jgi:hypothetical protein